MFNNVKFIKMWCFIVFGILKLFIFFILSGNIVVKLFGYLVMGNGIEEFI